MELQTLFSRCNVFYKIARKEEDLATLKANIGKYIHFSNSDRLGINYSGSLHPGNPKAVYGFPLTPIKYQKIVENKPDSFYDYGYHKYIYIFDVTGNVLDMDNINLPELSTKIKKFVNDNYPKGNWHAGHVPTPGPYARTGVEFLNWIGRISKEVFKNEHSGVNVLMRGIGYDAMLTNNYGFGDDIPSEIAILTPSSVNTIAKVNNPMLTKEQIKEIDWYNSPEYATEQAEKEMIRVEQQKKREELIAKHTQKIEEERALWNKINELLHQKKFDEVEALQQEHKNKWKDLPAL